MNLRIRLTILSSVILTMACFVLTISMNVSADKAITNAIPLVPADNVIYMTSITTPAREIYTHEYEEFKSESIIAMLCVVLCGSVATYFVAGYTLKPLENFTKEVQSKNINNLSKQIPLPKLNDEVFALTSAFNQMSTNLEQSFQTQEQFSAFAAHEFRTPLAVMTAKLDVYKLCNAEDQNQELLDGLSAQIDKLSVLTNELLWFSKDLPLKTITTIDIELILGDLMTELVGKLEEKGMSMSITGENFSTSGDDALLERVFYNLIENAIKYGKSNTNVHVKLSKDNQTVEIMNCGVGIAQAHKLHIFEPFYRINPLDRVSGNGLGLAICKRILDKHDASISVLDNVPSGSNFKITFPS